MHMQLRIDIAAAYDPKIHETGGEGDATREAYGRLITELGNAENESLGIELDYRYRESPIVCGEDNEPPQDMLRCIPSTWPGARAPHLFLTDGTALYDRLGPWFTLLRFVDADVAPLERAAVARGVPLAVVDIRDAHAHSVYERDLVLVRPDNHAAWRGNAMPDDRSR